MSLVTVQCRACGGAVRLEVGQRTPRCLFCGQAALEERPTSSAVEQPGTFIPFEVDDDGAKKAFLAFSRSSIWYPGDLRQARLDLNRILLPAWAWSATLETHYAALVRDLSTHSNKRPVTGVEQKRVPPVLIPSSRAITRHELAAVAPYNNRSEATFDPQAPAAPFEPAQLGRAAALGEAQIALAATHERDLMQRIGGERIRVSCLYQGLEGRPLLLPVYVGAYRYRDRLYRVVINGQSGKLTGTAPVSALRIAAAILIFGGLALVLVLCLGLMGAAGGGRH